jgi:hypothetical protein
MFPPPLSLSSNVFLFVVFFTDCSNFCEQQSTNGRSCTNLRRDGFRYFQDSYLAPRDVLDADNNITIKFIKVSFTCIIYDRPMS